METSVYAHFTSRPLAFWTTSSELGRPRRRRRSLSEGGANTVSRPTGPAAVAGELCVDGAGDQVEVAQVRDRRCVNVMTEGEATAAAGVERSAREQSRSTLHPEVSSLPALAIDRAEVYVRRRTNRDAAAGAPEGGAGIFCLGCSRSQSWEGDP